MYIFGYEGHNLKKGNKYVYTTKTREKHPVLLKKISLAPALVLKYRQIYFLLVGMQRWRPQYKTKLE